MLAARARTRCSLPTQGTGVDDVVLDKGRRAFSTSEHSEGHEKGTPGFPLLFPGLPHLVLSTPAPATGPITVSGCACVTAAGYFLCIQPLTV